MARRGSSGLQSNPLADLLDDDEREKSAVAAAEAVGNVLDLPTRAVAPDPENPLSRLKPDMELINSIKAGGQLQAGVVVPIATWTSCGNDPNKLYIARAEAEGADTDDDKVAAIARAKEEIKYVIVFGHRRWAGSIEAGKDTYKAVITDTIRDNTTKRIYRLIENTMRWNLTPLEEAEELRRLISEDNLSQHEISRRTGLRQPYISKRIALLRLPASARQALADDVITVETANELSKMTDDAERINDVITQIISFPVDSSTDEERQRKIEARTRFALDLARRERIGYAAAKARAKLCEELTAGGVKVIDDPQAYFKGKEYSHRLHNEAEIVAAREAGTALAHVYSRDQVEWYTTEEPRKGTSAEVDALAEVAANLVPTPRTDTAPSVALEEQRLLREEFQREKIAADEARHAACLRIASKAPNRDQLTTRLAHRLLMCEATYDSLAQGLAVEWLTAAGLVDAEMKTQMLFGDSHRLDPKTAARVAYVYDLALDESYVRKNDKLDSRGGKHIERLIEEAGYMPSLWARQRLHELTATTS